jgi:hypothetical protein
MADKGDTGACAGETAGVAPPDASTEATPDALPSAPLFPQATAKAIPIADSDPRAIHAFVQDLGIVILWTLLPDVAALSRVYRAPTDDASAMSAITASFGLRIREATAGLPCPIRAGFGRRAKIRGEHPDA